MATVRYANGVIYRIICKDPTIKDIYVGSTCNFTQRKWGHKTRCNNEKSKAHNFNVYKFIRENGGWENFEMLEIIKYPCETKRELESKEREYIELLGGTLNGHIPTQTPKEWYETNKTEILEKQQQYNIKNKEKISENCKEYYQAHKQTIIDRSKEWKANNREAVNKSEQKYRDKNKETRTATIMCGCGKNYTKQNKARHDKTQRHIKWIGLT
jgi:hypothetical protein